MDGVQEGSGGLTVNLPSVLTRRLSVRDLFKWCARVSSLVPLPAAGLGGATATGAAAAGPYLTEAIRESILSEGCDTLLASCNSPAARAELATYLFSSAWHLPGHRFAHYYRCLPLAKSASA